MSARNFTFFIMMVCMVVVPFSVMAAQSDWVGADHMKARLIAAENADGIADLAVQVQIDDGWHSYWRSPGESGLPIRFDWTGTQNAKDFKVSWPLPKRYDEFGMRTFGYDGNVVFPISYIREDVSSDSALVLKLDAMVCKDICIPQSFLLKMDLPLEGIGRSNASLIGFGERKVPHVGDLEELRVESAVASKDALVVNVYADQGLGDADLIVELPSMVLLTEMDVQIDEADNQRAMYRFAAPEDIEDFAAYLSGKDVIFTLKTDKKAVEKKIAL